MRIIALFMLFSGFFTASLSAQLTLPPNGGNQKSVATQHMGLASVTVTYSSPDVHLPDGTDRTGKIWGQLVPYGLNNLGFGQSSAANPSPWRAGANENTTIAFSHDMLVEGQPIKAGLYGLHMIPGEKEWGIIFSKDNESWGSFSYRPENDALRVTVKPQACEYNEWLTFEFGDRALGGCTAHLKWENLAVPFKISVPDINELYVAKIRSEMSGPKSFVPTNVTAAVNFCANNKLNLDEAMTWINLAMDPARGGVKNFGNCQAKANVLSAQGKKEEATTLMMEAIKLPDANVNAIHGYARNLQAAKDPVKALEVFEYNYKKTPGVFTTEMGMVRGLSANGKYKEALEHAKKALPMAPNAPNKTIVEGMIKKLEANQDCN
jgi:Protein of unknown function (DUF2911)